MEPQGLWLVRVKTVLYDCLGGYSLGGQPPVWPDEPETGPGVKSSGRADQGRGQAQGHWPGLPYPAQAKAFTIGSEPAVGEIAAELRLAENVAAGETGEKIAEKGCE